MKVQLPNGKFMEGVPDDATDKDIMMEAIRIGAAEEGDFPHDFSAGNMLENAPGSFAGAGADLLNAVSSPVQTGKALYGLAAGGLGALTGAETDPENKQIWDAVSGDYAKKYGDWDNFKRYLENDPAGPLSDLSMALTGAGGAVGLAGKLGKAGNIVQKAGNVVAKGGAAIDPLNIAANAVAVPRLMKSAGMPENMMANAFDATPAQARTLLEGKYKPNEKSLARFNQDRARANGARFDIIADKPELAAAHDGIRRAKELLDSNPNMHPTQRAKIEGEMLRRQQLIDNDPDILAARGEYNNLAPLSDIFENSVNRAFKQGGNIDFGGGHGPAVAAGYGAGLAATGSHLAGTATGASVGAVLGGLHNPSIKSTAAIQMNKMRPYGAAFIQNRALTTLSMQLIRGIGEYDQQGQGGIDILEAMRQSQ